MKVIPLCDLRDQLNATDRHIIDSHQEATEPSLDQRRAVIRLFLSRWLINNLPEHIGTWGLEADDFQPVSPENARVLADEILRSCLDEKPVEIVPGDQRDWEPRVLERMPWYQSGEDPPPSVEDENDPGDVPTVPYRQLRDWFPDRLFDPASVAFFAYRFSISPTPTRFHHTWPHVIAMDRDLIGMLWLESG